MLSKFSVKKPFTVLVGVILVLVLGFVSFTRMSADLLPDINLPYVIVMTTYVGASPETVETVVSAPVESAMATISNIESIQSMSSENYSIVILQFAQTANMDSVSLDIREKLDQIESYWDDSVGHPIIMKINPNMLPQMIAAVGMPDMTDTEISEFAKENIIPSLESIEGVASVNATGLIEDSIHVVIREDKVALINERIAALIDEKFEEAYQQIADSREEIEKGVDELSKAEKEITKGENQLNSAQRELANGKTELNNKKNSTMAELSNAKLQITAGKADLEAAKMQITTNMSTANGYVEGLKQINTGLQGVNMAMTAMSVDPLNTLLNTTIPNTLDSYQTVKSSYDAAVTARDAAIVARDEAQVKADNNDPDAATAAANLASAESALASLESAVTTAAGYLSAAEGGLTTLKATLLDKTSGAGALFDDSTYAKLNNLDFKSATAKTEYQTILAEYTAYLTSNRTTLLERKAAIENQLSGLIGWTVTETYYMVDSTSGKYYDVSTLPPTEVSADVYNNRYKQLEADLKVYVETQNGVLGSIISSIKALDDKIIELYNGESEALIQFANGLSQLDLAEYKLESSKTQITSGKAEIESGKDQLEDAKTQLDDAVTQIDESKEDAIKAADMTAVLSIDTISALLTAQNFSMPAGYAIDGDDNYLVRVGDKPETVDELRELPIMKIPMTEDEIIYLADVADIIETNNADAVYTNVNGNRGVILSIQKQTGYSTGDVADKINDKFEDLRDQYKGISLISLMDQGVYIDLVMNSIFENVLIGGLLAVLVLILFLRDIRPTLVIAISIPISLIAAVVAMYFSGVTLNIISLSGLALGVGMLVDNSIVVIENIYRLRKEGREIKAAAVDGAKEVAGAIFASTLTTVSVFLPIVFTEGITRQLFVDMGLTIAYSLMASLLIALTVVPALATGLIRNVKSTGGKTTDTPFFKVYKKFLALCLKLKPLVILLAIVLLVVSVMLELTRGTAYFPAMDSPQISVSVNLSENSKLKVVTDATDELVEEIRKLPDIVDVGAMASSSTLSMLGGMSTSSSDTTSTSIYVTTTEDRSLTSAELAEEIKNAAAKIDGIRVSVETSTMDMSALGGSGISISIKGRNLDTLYELAEQVAYEVGNTEGIAKVSDIKQKSDPEFRITVDKEKAILKGLTVAQIFSQIYPKLQDAKASTQLATATDDISVYVESEADAKYTIDVLQAMTVKYTDADQKEQEILLSEVADFWETYSMATINRVDQTRVVTVSASLADGYNIGLVSADVEDNVARVEIPKGYDISFGGENEQIMDALKQLVLMVILAVVFIYLIMVAQFQSLLSPFIIMFTIPLAFTGGFAALYLTGNEISIVSMIGFVMLSGIIVNNGIVLVDYINQLREAGMDKKSAIVEAGATRLRPVLMTALTTILALLTMAFSKKMGADMTKPLAITVIGGMIYGTLMTLIVVPCIYDMFMRERKNRGNNGGGNGGNSGGQSGKRSNKKNNSSGSGNSDDDDWEFTGNSRSSNSNNNNNADDPDTGDGQSESEGKDTDTAEEDPNENTFTVFEIIEESKKYDKGSDEEMPRRRFGESKRGRERKESARKFKGSEDSATKVNPYMTGWAD